ncbi:hypothetical protein C8R48DRAFT_668103 [Suillus tomentosus]|nr:hypothetical protein C8R48DRAFT_668103 [Suillus tomentosus]
MYEACAKVIKHKSEMKDRLTDQELMRVARQWQQLKLLRWNGFAHESTYPKPGELGLFCPTCPQPRINVTLPTAYDEMKPRWLYGHFLVMDGNFKAEHLHPTNPEDEAWLMDGLGFMVGRKRYKAHLAIAMDSMQMSECNNHQAVNQANASQHKLEATGIGGIINIYYVGWRRAHIWRSYSAWRSSQELVFGMCMVTRTSAMHIPLSKYKEAKRGAADSSDAFEKLNESANPDMVIEWKKQEMAANASQAEDLSTMDLYEVWLEKDMYRGRPPSQKQVELNILQSQGNQPKAHRWLGAATWIASDITIEESHIVVSLQQTIDEFNLAAKQYLGKGFDVDEDVPHMNLAFVDDDTDAPEDDWEEGGIEPSEDDPTVLFHPEIAIIPLPSNIGVTRCDELLVTDLIAQEITLREGQTNDLLHAIWVHLTDKAVLFCTTVCSAKLQAQSTRAWAQQLVKLEAYNTLEKYRELEKKDLKTSVAVVDPNAWGQRNSTLPWFWSFEVQADSTSSDWMTKFYRVHWLHTKSLHNWWAEELLAWLARVEADTGNQDWDGHRCYAVRQVQVYRALADAADTSFWKVNPEFKWNH